MVIKQFSARSLRPSSRRRARTCGSNPRTVCKARNLWLSGKPSQARTPSAPAARERPRWGRTPPPGTARSARRYRISSCLSRATWTSSAYLLILYLNIPMGVC